MASIYLPHMLLCVILALAVTGLLYFRPPIRSRTIGAIWKLDEGSHVFHHRPNLFGGNCAKIPVCSSPGNLINVKDPPPHIQPLALAMNSDEFVPVDKTRQWIGGRYSALAQQFPGFWRRREEFRITHDRNTP